MKTYLTPPQPSLGLERIATALRRYAPPSVTVHTFPNISNNDLTIIYAIGRRDAIERQCEKILKAGKRYAIIQICLRSTMSPSTDAWGWIWENAAVVWSYYDLVKAIVDDISGGINSGKRTQAWAIPNFYHAPLGADAEVFKPSGATNKVFTIATSGGSRLQESVRECVLAAKQVGGYVFHVGRRAEWYPEITYSNGMADSRLAHHYSACQFVSGLRRTEGFELPAVEGLLCGARPLVFDNLDWRWNYGDHAIYLKEGTRQEVVDQLIEIFKRGAPPVTPEERERAVKRYDWKTIIEGFYSRLNA